MKGECWYIVFVVVCVLAGVLVDAVVYTIVVIIVAVYVIVAAVVVVYAIAAVCYIAVVADYVILVAVAVHVIVLGVVVAVVVLRGWWEVGENSMKLHHFMRVISDRRVSSTKERLAKMKKVKQKVLETQMQKRLGFKKQV